MFKDRREAGMRLAGVLPDLDPANAIVLALPRGGVPVAAEICKAHGLPLDLVLVKKIGLPGHEELALGAIADGGTPHVEINRAIARIEGYSDADVERLGREKLPEIERRRVLYLGKRAPVPLAGKTAIVVDDGVATGATLLAALASVRARGAKRVIVALPVAPQEIVPRLRGLADDVVILLRPSDFIAVGAWYRNFDQVGDEEVMRLLALHGPGRDEGDAPAAPPGTEAGGP